MSDPIAVSGDSAADDDCSAAAAAVTLKTLSAVDDGDEQLQVCGAQLKDVQLSDRISHLKGITATLNSEKHMETIVGGGNGIEDNVPTADKNEIVRSSANANASLLASVEVCNEDMPTKPSTNGPTENTIHQTVDTEETRILIPIKEIGERNHANGLVASAMEDSLGADEVDRLNETVVSIADAPNTPEIVSISNDTVPSMASETISNSLEETIAVCEDNPGSACENIANNQEAFNEAVSKSITDSPLNDSLSEKVAESSEFIVAPMSDCAQKPVTNDDLVSESAISLETSEPPQISIKEVPIDDLEDVTRPKLADNCTIAEVCEADVSVVIPETDKTASSSINVSHISEHENTSNTNVELNENKLDVKEADAFNNDVPDSASEVSCNVNVAAGSPLSTVDNRTEELANEIVDTGVDCDQSKAVPPDSAVTAEQSDETNVYVDGTIVDGPAEMSPSVETLEATHPIVSDKATVQSPPAVTDDPIKTSTEPDHATIDSKTEMTTASITSPVSKDIFIDDRDPLEIDESSESKTVSSTVAPKSIANDINGDDVVMVVTDSDDEPTSPSATTKPDADLADPPSTVVPADKPKSEEPVASTSTAVAFEPVAGPSGLQSNVSKVAVVTDDDVIMLDDDDDDDDDDENSTPIAQPLTIQKPEDLVSAIKSASEEPVIDGGAVLLSALKDQIRNSIVASEIHVSAGKKSPPPLAIAVPSLIVAQKKSPIKRTATGAAVRNKNHECINFECDKRPTSFVKAEPFILSHFKVPAKVSRVQYVCDGCHEEAIVKYEELCGTLLSKQPLLMLKSTRRPDLVEILDSSDEEGSTGDATANADKSLALPESVRKMFCNEFDSALQSVTSRLQMDQQLHWAKGILQQKIDANKKASDEIAHDMRIMQKMADTMYARLYRTVNHVIEELPPLDLNTNKQMQLAGPTYPPFGEIIYPPVDMVTMYYSVRQKLLAPWIPSKMSEPMEAVIAGIKTQCYKVKFLRMKGILVKCVPPTNMAYGTPPKVRLPVGTRVIALFQIDSVGNKEKHRSSFYPGVVAEPLQSYNRWRYLIFFDDGYAQYVSPDNVRLVCKTSKNVWDDVHPGSSAFIHTYLMQYKTQRPMVQVKKGQRMVTEWNGKWLYARVIEMDASLVQMLFEEGKRTEWIYRGSTRLGPLFREKQAQKHSTGLTKRNEPYVEYMSISEEGANRVGEPRAKTPPPPPARSVVPAQRPLTAAPPKPTVAVRPTPPADERRTNVAKKSASAPPRNSVTVASQPQPTVQHMNNSTIYVDEDNQPKGKVVYYTAKKHIPPRRFTPHRCGPNCLYTVRHVLSTYSPLAKPLLSGWERQLCKNRTRKSVIYRAPCGRRLRDMHELYRYLVSTKCPLNVENFSYDSPVICLAEYVISSGIIHVGVPDLSDGQEKMAVPSVNYYDKSMPPPCVYSAKRIPTEGVNLNLDTEFLCGCDCEDGCLDKDKCQCWQLTLAGAKFGNPSTPPHEVGYQYKRLPDPVPTGIYECNSRCKCNKTCLNRVAQHGLEMKLQVFKTGNRGWGLRCLNDVPKGSFICVYAGDLLTEQNANEAGDCFGDEYFAELDYIEVVENLKEGYEPDVVRDDGMEDDEDDEDDDYPRRRGTRNSDDDDEFVAANVNPAPSSSHQSRYNTRTKQKTDGGKVMAGDSNDNSDEDDEERQPISFMPNASQLAFDNQDQNATNKYRSVRKFFGKNETCYIMDAKKTGNIGRYFNHSCAPNLFVQNVFVDTHDLRFPWVAFFALVYIRAGTELTWNYNYDVGSVAGKVLYCQCGAESCRRRLL